MGQECVTWFESMRCLVSLVIRCINNHVRDGTKLVSLTLWSTILGALLLLFSR